MKIYQYYLIESIYRFIIAKFFLKPLAKTNIKPNQITFFALLISLISLISLALGNLFLAGFFHLVYSFLDYLDGSLARYKNLKSEFGKKFDTYVDIFTFNAVFLIYAFIYPQSFIPCILAFLLMNLYNIVCPFFIVPKIRAVIKEKGEYKRFGLKKILLEKNLLLGFDASMYGLLIAIGLMLGQFEIFCYFISFGFVLDLAYRLLELKRNLIS